jgi:predicted nucleic acid-binding protein
MRLVVDASVALKWFLAHRPGEHQVLQAAAVGECIEQSMTELYAPPHWPLEVVAVLARSEPTLIDAAIQQLTDLAPIVVGEAVVLKRAADLATSLSHHLFDTLYHAVALEIGATLVTADETYYAKAQHLGHIQRLADFAIGTGTAP